jgi:phosphatidylserine/phosphatidylglycerophosphate/cardiolipin synthase-like enzyme
MMTLRLVALALLFCVSCATENEQQGSPASICLVETVPRETVLDSPDIPDVQGVWIEMIRGAKQTLDVAQFYIANEAGEALEPVIHEVIAAAARGVKVRILAEKKFENIYPETLELLRNTRGTEVRILDISPLTGRGVHHAKYFVIDGRTLFVGSQNWDWRALSHINELGVRISDLPVAAAFLHVFNFDWALSAGASVEDASKQTGSVRNAFPVVITDSLGRHEITPVFSPRDLLPQGALWDETAIKDLMRSAKDSLKLQVLSYRSYPSLENELIKAAQRGVRVSVLVSDWSLSEKQQNDLKTLQRMPRITVKISSIPDFSGGFISFARVEHCKYLIADTDQAWIGTSNWSRDYFHSSRNAGIILRSTPLVKLLQDKYNRSWSSPYVSVLDPEKEYISRNHADEGGI